MNDEEMHNALWMIVLLWSIASIVYLVISMKGDDR